MKNVLQRLRSWHRRQHGIRHIGITAGIFLLFSLFLELTLFQYKFYLTCSQTPVSVTEFTGWEGLEQQPDGSFRVTKTNTVWLEVSDLDLHLETLRLNVYRESKNGYDQFVTPVTLSVTDAANAEYMQLPTRRILPFVSNSQYIRLHLAGNTDQIRIGLEASKGDLIHIRDFTLNTTIPIQFSFLRLFLLTLILTVLYYIRPSGGYFRMCWNPDHPVQRSVTNLVMFLQIMLFAAAVCANPWFMDPPSRHHQQYHELAVALSQGHFYLDTEPCQALKDMENPYDSTLRADVMAETGSTYLFDHAYYNGKYYVYFGVVPVLIFYLPWYLITGTAFPTFLGIMFSGICLVFGVYRLMELILERFDPKKISYLTVLLLTTLFVNSCGVLAIMRRPDFYSLPILMGVTFSILGLNCWLSSIKPDRISGGKMFLGCLCMALVAGCRPQLALASFLIFPIFWDAVFRKRLLFSRKGLCPTLLAILPYVLVAGGLMYYNYARFGSPFDFGANYNLTTNDMTKRGIVPARLPIALFTYFLQPPVITAQFPFINRVSLQTAYMGRTIYEATYGGFLAVNLISWAGLALVRIRTWFADRKLWIMGIMCLILAVVLACFDAEGAGILLRYYSDFGWLIMLASVLGFLTIAAKLSKRPAAQKALWIYLMIAFLTGMAFHVLLIFTDGGVRLQDTNPELFYYFYYHLQFWM